MHGDAGYFQAQITLQNLGLLRPSLKSAEVTDYVHIPVQAAVALPARSLNEPLRTTLCSLKCAVEEESVFAAVTGPKHSGKSTIITELLATCKSREKICVDIRSPHRIASTTAAALFEAIRKAITRVEGTSHVLLVVDNAHTSSDDLLLLLNRFAVARSSISVPQVILVGEPELWDRLSQPRYNKLLQRFALRCELNDQRSPKSLWRDLGANEAIAVHAPPAALEFRAS